MTPKIIAVLRGGAIMAVATGVLGCGAMNPLQKDEGYTYPVQLSRDIPAAQAKLNVTPREDGGRNVELDVKHLAPPQALDPQAVAYVVWIQPAGAPAQNVGVLQVDKDREAEFEVTTNYEKFEVLVTSESRPNVQKSKEEPLMRASVDIPRRGTF